DLDARQPRLTRVADAVSIAVLELHAGDAEGVLAGPLVLHAETGRQRELGTEAVEAAAPADRIDLCRVAFQTGGRGQPEQVGGDEVSGVPERRDPHGERAARSLRLRRVGRAVVGG